MTNYIGFCLYGDNPKYVTGALRNADEIKVFYPHWRAVFYVGESVPEDRIAELEALGAKIFRVAGPEDNVSMVWRFRAFLLEDADFVLIRDCDSRLSHREVLAVNEWLGSGKALHILRDHVYHGWNILGGLWGGVANELKPFIQDLLEDEPVDRYGFDQELLTKHVYGKFKSNACIHDSVFFRELASKRFPSSRIDGEYVAEVINENGEMDQNLRDIMIRFESSASFRLRVRLSDFFNRPPISTLGVFSVALNTRITYYRRVLWDVLLNVARNIKNHP